MPVSMPTERSTVKGAVGWTVQPPGAASRQPELPASRGIRSRWGMRYLHESDLESWGPISLVGRAPSGDPARAESESGYEHLAPRGEYSHAFIQVALVHSSATAQREHRRGEVDQSAGQRCLEVGDVVTAAAAEVQQGPGLPLAVGLEQAPVEGGLLGVVPDRREKRIPVRQVSVESGRGSWC